MRVITHHMPYPSLEIHGDTVAEVLEGWSRQVGLADVPLDQRMVMEIIDFDTPEKLAEKTDVEEIHIFPALFGGGGFGRILIGAALIVVGAVLAPFSIPVNIAIAVAGLSLVLGGIMQLFMKAPTTNKSNDPAASKYLGNSVNTTQIGTIIARGAGRMRAGGQYLSVQVDSSDLVYGRFPTTIPA